MRFGDGDEVGENCVEYIYVVDLNELEALDEEYLVHPRLNADGDETNNNNNNNNSDNAIREWLRRTHFTIPETYMHSTTAVVRTPSEIKAAWTAFMVANKNRRHNALAAILFCIHSMDAFEGLLSTRREIKSIPLKESTTVDYSPGR
jgi:hypothetical protein